MRRAFLFVFYCSIYISLFSQTVEELEIAITKKDYNRSNELARELIRSEVSIQRAYGNWALGVAKLSDNPDSANHFLQRALSENPDEILKIKILNAQANYYDITGSTEKSIDLFLKVVSLSRQYDPSFLAGAYNNLCIGYRTIEKFDSSVYFGFEGLKVAEVNNQLFEQKRLYNSIAISFAVQDDLESAGKYFRKSLRLALSNEDSVGASKGFVNLTQLMVYQEQLDSALFFLGQAELFNIKSRTTLDIVDMYSLMAEVMVEEKKFREAVGFLDMALNQLQVLNYPSERAYLFLSKSNALLKAGFYNESQQSLGPARSLFQLIDGASGLLEVEKLQKELLISQGRFKEALEVDQTIDSLKNIRLSSEKVKAVEDIRAKYETEKKEQQIEILEQEAALDQLKIRQQELLIIGIALVLTVIIIAGYSIYKNRVLRLSQQRLLIEQQLLRSQMNPHFLFNALASIHAFIFKGDKREASDYLTTFSELTRDILDHSSKEWITLQKELETLEKYMLVQKLRFPEVDHKINVAESVEQDNTLIPPMLLQPFVENSFEHGLKDQNEGNISIDIKEDASQLIIEIKDDGIGLSQSQSDHESKAVSITTDRLRILYGNRKSHLSLKNRIDKSGVLVTIVIPKEEAL